MSTASRLVTGAAVAASLALVLAGCSAGADDSAADGVGSTADGITTLTVGATFPADDILKHVDETQAEAAGLKIEVTSFTDYTTPNTALQDGSLDANLYQHLPFLTTFNEQNGTDLTAVGKVYFPALALYSKTLDSVDEIEDGSTISIPNDPTNELRSLVLLEEAGLITLKDDATGILGDIVENPKDLVFQELDAATLPRALDENPAGIANLSYALPAGLTADEQIYTEDVEGTLYTNTLAVKTGNEDDEAIQKLYELLTSDETQAWITEEYKGLVIPASGPAE